MNTLFRVLRVFGGLLALMVVLYSMAYLQPGMPEALEAQRELYLEKRGLLLTHITGASVAMLLTPFQLWGRLRRQWPRVHRVMGRVLALGIGVGGSAGVGMAFYAYGGWSNRIGFATLGVLWVATTVVAIRLARSGDIAGHRRWMIRSASLTFAAVTLRVWVSALEPVLGFESAYAVMGWLCWVPNLVVAQWWISRRFVTRGTPALASSTDAVGAYR